ncbi:SdiA-regulated domain-containing protein [Pedobacter arcticus]|uniref:SdiA-regulated domain-containing protein n=1 Tax=Pedobacter arcticus TaxID=752140 RepID=UPI0002D85BC1|nr:SdiA-regulated domain-containing protein [Pedobacter arcticus]
MNKTLLALLVVSLMSCGNNKKKPHNKPALDSTVNIIEVPKKLKEISAISFINDSLVAIVEDEKGVLYFFDLNKQKIVREFPFAEDGDYEDLARNGDDIYVVRADGVIYEIANFVSENPQVTYYKTALKSKHDIEGLAYDVVNNRLLLSVKEKNLNKAENENEVKNIYQFTLKDKKFHNEPAMRIFLKDIGEQFKGDELMEASKHFLKAAGNKNLNDVMKPSAMTYHPTNGKLYVLSAINNFVLELNADGSFSKIIRFSGKEFIQPEGLDFNSKGEMFISNEGKNKKGNIVKLKP